MKHDLASKYELIVDVHPCFLRYCGMLSPECTSHYHLYQNSSVCFHETLKTQPLTFPHRRMAGHVSQSLPWDSSLSFLHVCLYVILSKLPLTSWSQDMIECINYEKSTEWVLTYYQNEGIETPGDLNLMGQRKKKVICQDQMYKTIHWQCGIYIKSLVMRLILI